MNAKVILSRTLGLAVALWAPMAVADSLVSGSHISATQGSSSHINIAIGGGQSSMDAVISGQNGVIAFQDDRVVVEEGRLTLNGIPYGTVGPQSIVRFTVHSGVKRLLVDGVERAPVE